MKKLRWTITEETLFASFLFLLACLFFVVEQAYPPQAKFFPTLVLIPLLAGTLYVVITGARVPADEPGDPMKTWYEFRVTAGWMLTLLLLIALTGLVGSMTLFPLLYMRFYCRERWTPTLITTAIVGVGSWAFITFLQIPMYFGVILEALGF